jgi:N-acetyl-anhydromuramyl-L-alanine amidase AmpD
MDRPQTKLMKITDHWLDPVQRQPLPGGATMPVRRFLIVHHTAGATGQSSINYWRQIANGVCAHLVIERDGTVIQIRPFDRTCGHAGPSRWTCPDSGKTFFGLNHCSIGIELANAGNSAGALTWAKRQPGYQGKFAAHKSGGPTVEWEAYPPAQLAACEAVSKVLVARYNLDDVIGHEDCSPGRKTDPGPAFPMAALRAACGIRRPL